MIQPKGMAEQPFRCLVVPACLPPPGQLERLVYDCQVIPRFGCSRSIGMLDEKNRAKRENTSFVTSWSIL